jgi:hypothetical protein
MKSLEVMSIGIDIDGTITADPLFFSALSRGVRNSGGYVHIVSSRSREGRSESIAEVRDFGIIFDEFFLLPSIEAAQELCPHSVLNWFDRHAWLKVDYAQRFGLTHFVDDDRRIIELFRMYAPEIQIVPALERHALVEFVCG